MDMEKIKDVFAKGAKVSKEAFEKAGSAVQSFSDKSVLKIEKQQLKNSRDKKYNELGQILSQLLCEKGADILKLGELSSFEAKKSDFDKIKKLQKEILGLNKDIKEREKALDTEKAKKN